MNSISRRGLRFRSLNEWLFMWPMHRAPIPYQGFQRSAQGAGNGADARGGAAEGWGVRGRRSDPKENPQAPYGYLGVSISSDSITDQSTISGSGLVSLLTKEGWDLKLLLVL